MTFSDRHFDVAVSGRMEMIDLGEEVYRRAGHSLPALDYTTLSDERQFWKRKLPVLRDCLHAKLSVTGRCEKISPSTKTPANDEYLLLSRGVNKGKSCDQPHSTS